MWALTIELEQTGNCLELESEVPVARPAKQKAHQGGPGARTVALESGPVEAIEASLDMTPLDETTAALVKAAALDTQARPFLETGAAAEVAKQVRARLKMAELMGVLIGATSGCCHRRTGLTEVPLIGVARASLETAMSTRFPLESDSVEASSEAAPLETTRVGTAVSLEGTEALAA